MGLIAHHGDATSEAAIAEPLSGAQSGQTCTDDQDVVVLSDGSGAHEKAASHSSLVRGAST